MFLLVKNIRNLKINLRNKLLYSYIFNYIYEGVGPIVNTSLFTLNLVLSQFFKNDSWIRKVVE